MGSSTQNEWGQCLFTASSTKLRPRKKKRTPRPIVLNQGKLRITMSCRPILFSVLLIPENSFCPLVLPPLLVVDESQGGAGRGGAGDSINMRSPGSMPWRSLGDIVQAWRPFPVTDDPGDRDPLRVSLGLSAVAINGLADQRYVGCTSAGQAGHTATAAGSLSTYGLHHTPGEAAARRRMEEQGTALADTRSGEAGLYVRLHRWSEAGCRLQPGDPQHHSVRRWRRRRQPVFGAPRLPCVENPPPFCVPSTLSGFP